MGFLLRTAFWFSLVLLALPLDGPAEHGDQQPVNAIEALIAAGEAVTDIAGMCDRKPDVCETGRSAISTIGVRARQVSRIAYETFDKNDGIDTPGAAGFAGGPPLQATDATATGSVQPQEDHTAPTTRMAE